MPSLFGILRQTTANQFHNAEMDVCPNKRQVGFLLQHRGDHFSHRLTIEGRAAGEALGKKGAPVDAAIIGIVDAVTVDANL